MLDRSMASLTMESRLLTTAMLTKLADLRGRRQVAFFIATNRLTALDAAVTRPGRFGASSPHSQSHRPCGEAASTSAG